MLDKKLFSGDQQGLPSMEHRSGDFKSVSFIAQLYGVTETAVRNWIEDEIVDKPINGLLDIYKVIKQVYQHQRQLIETAASKGLTSERTKIVAVKREIHEIELEKMRGKLVDVEKIRRVAFSRAKLEAEMLHSLPSRLKSILAAETDEFKVGQILQQEIEHITKKTIEICQEKWQ